MSGSVSVLMCNYNTKVEYLKKAIESVLNQTYTDFEFIIIEDGSTDESPQIIQKYSDCDSRICYYENEYNMGLAKSLNRGMNLCEGKYIFRMDTDDICYPDRLEKQIKYMDEHPDLLFSGAWADVFSIDEETIDRQWKYMIHNPEEYHIRLLFANNPLMIHPTVVFRKEQLKRFHLNYDTSDVYRYAEDYRMWTLCTACGKAGILEEVVLKYRDEQNEDRITIKYAEQMKTCSRNVQQKLLDSMGLRFDDNIFEIHNNMLNGRKQYDLRMLNWIKKLVAANDKFVIYNQKLFRKILYEKWYETVYYAIAYDRSIGGRLGKFNHLSMKQKFVFLFCMIKKFCGLNID